MHRPVLSVLAAAAVVGATVTVAAPASAVVPSPPNAVVQLAPQPAIPVTPPPKITTFFDSSLKFQMNSVTTGVVVSSAGFDVFGVVPPQGQKLTPGTYLWRGTVESIIPVGSNHPNYVGLLPIDILDVGSNSAGTITRFDAVVSGYGEFRFGEPSDGTSALLGTRNVVFPEQFVGSIPGSAPETIHNRGTSPVSLGTPTVSGVNASSFTGSAGTCGPTLKAGASCTMQLGFAPKMGGPLSAFVKIPVGGVVQTVNVTGSAPLGTSSITLGGSDPIDRGVTTRDVAGPLGMYVYGNTSHIIFDTAQPLQEGATPQLSVVLDTTAGKAPTIGTHVTGPDAANDVQVTAFGVGSTTTGTDNVKVFDVDANGVPTVVNMTFTEKFDGYPGIMTGTLLWHYRPDLTPPSAPTALSVSTGHVSWKTSTSKDSSYVMARLVAGDGTAATPSNGIPLDVTGSSAALPKLPSGERFTVALFDVDTSGNVSNVALKQVTP